MQIRSKHLNHDQICAIVDRVGRESYAGNIAPHVDNRPMTYAGTGYTGRIVALDSRGPGARRSSSGRRMTAACWHAFRDTFRAILVADPDAVIVTAMARYDGRDGFERTYPATGSRNVGSQASSAYMPELCDCDKNTR